jgi:hypothetical protein
MRTILFVLALLGAVAGRAQIFLDWYSQAPAAALLLDQYPNAAVAFSLRALNSAYTGNCIEVRRSNDNATQNIGFAGGIIDTAALKTFCGANNCFVRTWYDQSGNGRNAVQTTNANQPQIVASGVVIRQGARVALQFTAAAVTGLIVNTSGVETSAAMCAFYSYATTVAAAANTNTAVLFNQGQLNTTSRVLIHASSTGNLANETVFFDIRQTISGSERLGSTTYTRAANTSVVESFFLLSSGTTFEQNNSSVSLNLTAGAANTTTNYTGAATAMQPPLVIGAAYTTALILSADQRITEMIFYPTDQSTNRAAIASNLMTYYN